MWTSYLFGTEKDRKEFHAFCGRCGAKMVEPKESEETREQYLIISFVLS